MPALFLAALQWCWIGFVWAGKVCFTPPQEPWQTLLWWRWKGNYEADATQPSARCVHCTVSFPGTYLNISIMCLHLTYIYPIVLLREKNRTLNFCELQTQTQTQKFEIFSQILLYHLISQSLSEYMGISIIPLQRILFSVYYKYSQHFRILGCPTVNVRIVQALQY